MPNTFQDAFLEEKEPKSNARKKVDFNNLIKKFIFSLVFIIIASLLYYLTLYYEDVEKILMPMHIPVMLCGCICGSPFGLIVGLLTPFTGNFLTHSILSTGDLISICSELALYGCFSGLFYKSFPKKSPLCIINVILSFIISKVASCGIIYLYMMFTVNKDVDIIDFVVNDVKLAVPGIILQVVLIPIVIAIFKKFDITLNDD